MTLSSAKIDKIGEALRSADFCADVLIELDAYRRTFESAYVAIAKLLREGLRKDGVTGRPSKSTGAIVEKLMRGSFRLSQIQDIAGCRVVVEDVPAQDRLIRALKVFLPDQIRIVDRRHDPSFGYRAVHVIAKVDRRCVEIQIRTIPQHLWAEISEKLADTIDNRIKYGEGEPSLLEALYSLTAAIAALEREESERDEALQTMSGKIAALPKPQRKRFHALNRRYLERRDRLINSLHNVKEIVNRLER
jgi:ppGpp synthetase/RelA/SpoT-type nucleotidyltranferase